MFVSVSTRQHRVRTPAEYLAMNGSAWLPQGSAMVALEFCWAVHCQPAVCPVVQDLRVQAEEIGQHMAGLAGNGLAGACTPLALQPAEGGHHSHIAAALEAQQHSLRQLQRLKELLNEELAALSKAAWLPVLLSPALQHNRDAECMLQQDSTNGCVPP